MKNYFLIAAFTLTLTSGTSFSQACKKYTMTDATDNFTGEPAYFTKKIVYSQPTVEQSRSISFRIQDDKRVFLHLTSGKSQDIVFGSDVLLTFADGETMTLQIEQVEKIKEGTVYVTHGNCRIYYKHDLERFYTHKLVSINILAPRLEFEFTKQKQTAILASALCLAEYNGIDNLNFSSERNTTLTPDPSATSFMSTGGFVSIGGSIKCEYDTDTLIDGKNQIRISKPREIAASPYKLHVQVSLDDNKIKLLFKYASDLGNINSSSYILFKFNDESVQRFKHAGSNQNDSQPVFEVDITTYKDVFMTKDIDRIRLSYSEYYTDLNVSNARYIADYLRYCLQ